MSRKLFIVVPVACLAGAAYAGTDDQVVEGSRVSLTRANSIFGPTGLINIPTAYVTPHGEYSFSASFGRNLRAPAVNYGIVPYIEIGGAFIDREFGSNKAIANAKVQLIPSNFKWFEVGVGIIDAVDAIDQTIYFVASADLAPPKWDVPERGLETIGLKAHVGAGTGMFNEKLFGGAEVLFTKKLSVIGEWDTNDFNAAVRFSPTEYFRVQVGIQGKDIHLGATTTFRF